VATHRAAPLVALSTALAGFEMLAASRWTAWVRKQGMGDRLPADFGALLRAVTRFADLLMAENFSAAWDPAERSWSDP
jgi:hypothetical protein